MSRHMKRESLSSSTTTTPTRMSTTDQSQTQAQSQVVNDTTMSKSNELFDEEQKIDVELNDSNAAAAASSGVKGDTRERVSWLNASFFLSDQRLLFGTWSVFSATLLNVFSVIMLIRSGWMVANAGVLASLLVILVAILIALISVTSAVGLCEKCKLNKKENLKGGIIFLLAHVLGTKVAVAIGLFYCFGQAINSSLTLAAFGESICKSLEIPADGAAYASRLIGVLALLLVLIVNLAGVKWVNRLQQLLMLVLAAAVLDFVVGSFFSYRPLEGVTGYEASNLWANLYPAYAPGESVFTVYGVFFPAMTGIFTGVNMAFDLKRPQTSIPIGTFSGISTCTVIYGALVVIEGSVSLRSFLYDDSLIAEKISLTGFVFLTGLYVCSISSIVSAFYMPGRIIHSIAKQDLFPQSLAILKIERGQNKTPVVAIILVACVTFIFILVGQINILAPIVSMPFMLTYAAVNYAFFALETTTAAAAKTGVFKKPNEDKKPPTPDQKDSHKQALSDDIYDRDEPNSDSKFALSFLSNRWLSFMGAVLSILSMIVVNYVYALSSFVVCYVIYLQLRIYRPGLPRGLSKIDVSRKISNGFSKLKNCCTAVGSKYKGAAKSRESHRHSASSVFVITPTNVFAGSVSESQVTCPNTDYMNRRPYHHFEHENMTK